MNKIITFILIFITCFSQKGLKELDFSGVLNSKNSEISGLVWYKDNLVILPQYPLKSVLENDALFTLSKKDLISAIDTQTKLNPIEITLKNINFLTKINGFEGFESISIHNDTAYFTIEASSNSKMSAYLVKAYIKPDLSEMTFNETSLTKIPMSHQIKNMAYESSLIYKDVIYVFYEANGFQVNPTPLVHKYDLNLNYLSPQKIDTIDYRITDVTNPINNSFWAINYMWPGENKRLKPKKMSKNSIENIVQYQFENDELIVKKTIPLKLSKKSRNWEGIVELENKGFIIATDKFPKTIIAFVAY